jgi:hypothetical protein
VAKFKYLRTTVTNQNFIRAEIKSRLNSDNACYHSVQDRLSFRRPYKSAKIEIYNAIILPVVLYGYEKKRYNKREVG